MMSILTYPNLLNRALVSYDNLKMFFPFNAGTGNDHADVAGDVVITDDGTCSWTTLAHAATTNCTGAITSGSMPTIAAGKSLILMDMVKINTSASLQITSFGADAGAGERRVSIGISAAVADTNGSNGNTAAFQTLTAGQICVRLMTWNTSTGVLSVYSKVGSAASQFDATATNSGTDHLGAISFPTENITIGGNATVGDWFGDCLISCNELPSDAVIISEMDTTYSNWLRGLNVPPESFRNI